MTDKEASPQNLWKDLENQNILPVDGVLMRSCEQELQELVQHIDILVKNRETDLKQQVKKVYKHFEKKTKECQQQKITLEENSKKILALQSQVDWLTAEKQKAEEIHETQVTNLKSKAALLRTEHERLHKTFLRKMHNMEKRSKSADGHDDNKNQQIQQLTEKLKECENQLKAVQEEKDILQGKFESMESECKVLQRKRENLEAANESLTMNLEESEKQRQEGEHKIYKFRLLVKQQNDDLVDYGKSDDLLKRAVITLRTDLQTKIATITNLQSELEQYKEDQAHRMKNDYEMLETLQNENQQLHQDLVKHKEYMKEYSSLKEQLELLKAEKVVLGKIISDQTEKLKNHKTKMQLKIDEVEENFDEVWMAQARNVDEETAKLELQLINQQQNRQEKEEFYEETEDKEEQDYDDDEEEVEIEEVEEEVEEETDKEHDKEVGVEEMEKENKRVDVDHRLSKEVGDRVHQSLSALNSALNSTSQTNLQHVIDAIGIEPKPNDSVFCVSQSQIKDFLHKEQIYRKDWEDNFSKELHRIWHNTEGVIQRYINSL